MEYHYQQAIELLFAQNPDINDLIDAYGDLKFEYGQIHSMGLHGLRANVEPELQRFRVVTEALKFRIKNHR